ncbi:hypothetical protein KP509_25G013700 [Ceratopteris richardii]|uniref:Homeobox domain-containing protein n=1 Tax=Ceratopteris richardii TaxID=49495 RepID=A0A8T2RMT1_CERRI|nr:hypothetical protein KP509_25G013700 [Ceratopteris richardii]KAH7297809.1 hypothetical protein KP509_25G013700 [Ceratopteris richardii]KAH7297810.1 hypothetical protein KP509_25G013700 [Ceratopteris richardii]KAH7297811.1 hypothetical protein KP509_25G013700 [Ceratopteris richardii]
MTSVTPLGFPNAIELLASAGAVPHYLHTAQTAEGSESPGDGTCISAGESTVTFVKTEAWTKATSDCDSLQARGFHPTLQDGFHPSIDRLALLASVASESAFRSASSSSAPSRENNMSTYISGPNSQAETLQSLHLMNNSFSSYGDLMNTGNMVLFNAAAVGNPLGSAEQQQHHILRFALPSAINHASCSHPSQMTAISNLEMGHQNESTDFYTKRTSSQGYTWGERNELSFLSSEQVAENNQPIGVQSNLIRSEEIPASGVSHFDSKSLNRASYLERTHLSADNIENPHGMHTQNLQTPSHAGQILSLSLSSQQPSVMQQLHAFSIQGQEPAGNIYQGFTNSVPENFSKEGMFHPSRCSSNSLGGSFAIPICDSMLGTGYPSQINAVDGRHLRLLADDLTTGRYGSKYLKPAQELLSEVVSLRQDLRDVLRKSKSQSCTVDPSSGGGINTIKTMNLTDPPSRAILSWGGGKDVSHETTTASISMAGNSKNITEPLVELSSTDRQDLHFKRAKLVGMRDEVDRRYKKYYHQMQIVVASFESVAGRGAATTYTAPALQTISKHFRCLRDAIAGQIQVTCKALGEEDIPGVTKGETSKLRFIDQQLRQQHALRQLGMMQQQAWRPQRGLPERSVSILRAWLFEHFLHPYPKDADKIMLAKQTGLSRNQVSNWFINARVRLWKPMVEEMYVKEMKEADPEQADASGGMHEEGESNRQGSIDNDASIEFSKPFKQVKLSDTISQGFQGVTGERSYSLDLLEGQILCRPQGDNILLQGKEDTQQGAMKLGPASQDVTSVLGPGYKADNGSTNGTREAEDKVSKLDENHKNAYPVAVQNGFIQADQLNLAAYGSSYPFNGINRYSRESFSNAANYLTNSGVSLTLGLQHCEGITFSGGQQPYAVTQGSASHLLTGQHRDNSVSSADYDNVNTNNFEVLGPQSRKLFPTQTSRHDFVV